MTTKDTTAEKMAHTPGPWMARESALSRNNDLWFISAGVLRVAETFSAENARLIAAAPTMYQELELAADTFRDFGNVLTVLGKNVMAAAADVAERHIREQLAAIVKGR